MSQFPDCSGWLCTCGKCVCGRHPCAVHGKEREPEAQHSHYDTVYTRYEPCPRNTKCPALMYALPPPYKASDLVTTQQGDYINHRQPKPKIVKKLEGYKDPSDEMDHSTTYLNNYRGEQGPKARHLRPPSKPADKGKMYLQTTHKATFKDWDVPGRTRYIHPKPEQFFQGKMSLLSTNQNDFNTKRTKLGKPATSCKVEEKAVASKSPLAGSTTMKDGYRTPGLEEKAIVHRGLKKVRFSLPPVQEHMLTRYDSDHPPGVPRQERRGLCLPPVHGVELKRDGKVRLETEQHSMYVRHPVRPATPFRPLEAKHTSDEPLEAATTHRVQFAQRGKPVPARQLRPMTETRNVGEMDLRTTHGEEFAPKKVKLRRKCGDRYERDDTVPAAFNGLSTFDMDYRNYGSQAKPAQACRPLDMRYGAKDTRSGPFDGATTYTREFVPKLAHRICPASLVPVVVLPPVGKAQPWK